MVTIKDVAADAGVSVGTVSKVLNNMYVKADNRRRVEESIHKLGYQVNTYARGLKAQQTFTVAIIVPDLINPFFALLVNYVEQVLAAVDISCWSAIPTVMRTENWPISIWPNRIRWMV